MLDDKIYKELHLIVKLWAYYWHLVDVVWIGLFTMFYLIPFTVLINNSHEITGLLSLFYLLITYILLYYSIIPSLGLLYLKRTCIRYKIEGKTKYYNRNYQADAELCLCVQFLIGGLYCYNIIIFFYKFRSENEVGARSKWNE